MEESLILFLSLAVLCCQTLVADSSENRLDKRKTMEDFLDVCMLGNNHKTKPGPEPALYQSCSRWTQKSCCHQNTTSALHKQPTWYNFNWNHCEGRSLSDKCKQHFVDDLCFYECSPNVGPWLVSDSRTWRQERISGVPLCQSECNAWWEDCKADFTCRDNWYTGFDWSTGTNKCKAESECKTFEATFKTAKNFCEKVWDDSWKVVPDGDQCFHIKWTTGDNPNNPVAAAKAKEFVDSINSSNQLTTSSLLVFLCSFLYALH